MKNTYSPKEFGALIGRSVITLQKWDRKGTLIAHRSPTTMRLFFSKIKIDDSDNRPIGKIQGPGSFEIVQPLLQWQKIVHPRLTLKDQQRKKVQVRCFAQWMFSNRKKYAENASAEPHDAL